METDEKVAVLSIMNNLALSAIKLGLSFERVQQGDMALPIATKERMSAGCRRGNRRWRSDDWTFTMSGELIGTLVDGERLARKMLVVS